MAKSSSSSENEAYDDSYCSKSCRKNTKNLNTKISKLNEELSDCENNLYHYKIGLSQVEARLVEFKTQEIKFCKKIRGLERDVEVRNNKIEYLMHELEQVKKEKEGLDNKLIGFESASKDLDTLLGSQRTDKNKEGLGYNAVPPPHPLRKICLGQDCLNLLMILLLTIGESSSSIMSKPVIKFVKAADCPGRQLNDKRKEKAVWDNARRVNHQNSPRITHPNLKRHMVLRKILTRSGPISLNTARQGHLNVVCCCCSRQVNTARPKAVINVVRTNRVNDAKASTCWVWRPIKSNSASITLKRYEYVDVRGRSKFVWLGFPRSRPPAGHPPTTTAAAAPENFFDELFWRTPKTLLPPRSTRSTTPRATHHLSPYPAVTTTITTSPVACCHHIYIISTPLTSSPTSPRHYRHTHHPLHQQQPPHRLRLVFSHQV
nr:hypothetical protein [Tanacetum cinerariifolium]